MIRYGAQHLIIHFFYPVTVLSLWYGILYLIYYYYYSLSRLLLFPYSHFVPSFSGSQKHYSTTRRTRDTCRTLTQIQNTNTEKQGDGLEEARATERERKRRTERAAATYGTTSLLCTSIIQLALYSSFGHQKAENTLVRTIPSFERLPKCKPSYRQRLNSILRNLTT